MLFPGVLVLASNLCSGGRHLLIASPSECPTLRVTGSAGTQLTNRPSALKGVLQPLTDLSLCPLEANWDFSMKVKRFVGGLASN